MTFLVVGIELAHASEFELPSDGSAVIGTDTTITTRYEDTLLDIARQYSLGYDEIIRANPGVDMWIPGEGTRIVLPGRRILPPGPREGVVVSLPEHRLYYFPSANPNGRRIVITFPVSIGKLGRSTPLGQTRVIGKVAHPSWYPTASIRKEHADAGDPLPAVVGPGPDNPLGDYKIRLGFGNGTYEIHGTNNPTAVGLAITHGCIRMYPEDVAALFPQLPIGTPVRLINSPVKVAWIDGELLLEAHPPVNAQGESFEPDVDRFSALLRSVVGDASVAINWDYAREVLKKASGVIATVGLEAEATSDREPLGRKPALSPARQHIVPAGDPVHAHVQDLGGMCTLGGIQILPVHGDRAPRMRGDLVGDPSCVRARGAVRSDPMNAVENRSAASATHASLSVDAEGNAEFVAVQPHDERCADDGDGVFGGKLCRRAGGRACTRGGNHCADRQHGNHLHRVLSRINPPPPSHLIRCRHNRPAVACGQTMNSARRSSSAHVTRVAYALEVMSPPSGLAK
jgi:L,D-transpeptidase ErfK/SrfK